MSKSLPTVAVNRGGHKAIINESDFDPGLDTLWSEDHAEREPIGIQRGQDEETPQAQETEVAIALESPALALINGSDVARDVAIIPTLGQAAAAIIIDRSPEGGYESLAQVWELCPEVLGGRMKVDPDVVAAWGSEPD